jgi:hypothetical protein
MVPQKRDLIQPKRTVHDVWFENRHFEQSAVNIGALPEHHSTDVASRGFSPFVIVAVLYCPLKSRIFEPFESNPVACA